MKNHYFWIFWAFFLAFATPKAFCGDTLQLSTPTLDFGHEGTQKKFSIENAADKVLFWDASSNASWMTLSPQAGKIDNPSLIDASAPYVFSNMWPQKPHTWYVVDAQDINIDRKGNIYVTDSSSTPVKKFNKQDELILEITDSPIGYAFRMAFDLQNNFYVYDDNQRDIKKYSSSGQFLKTITPNLTSPLPVQIYDMAIDSRNNIYIADVNNFSIHKLDADGNHLLTFGQGHLGNYSRMLGLVIDSHDFIYVADNHFYRIQKFSSNGRFIKKWGWGIEDYDTILQDQQDGALFAIDEKDVLYIGHKDSGFLTKFTKEGQRIPTHWDNPQWFDTHGDLGGMGIDENEHIYLSSENGIFKFDSNGKVLKEFRSHGQEPGQVWWPVGMTKDPSDYIYVLDENAKIHILNPHGNYLNTWNLREKITSFNWWQGGPMAADHAFNIYLGQNNKLFKLNPSGEVIGQWTFPAGIYFSDLAVDSQGFLHLVSFQHIRKVSPSGEIIDSIDLSEIVRRDTGLLLGGSPKAAFNSKNMLYITDWQQGVFIIDPETKKCISHFNYQPHKNTPRRGGYTNTPIAIDEKDNVYVLFVSFYEIQKFDAQGKFLSQWGSFGTTEGKMVAEHPNESIAVGRNGKVYVAEHKNNRVQVFSPSAVPVTVTIDRNKLTLPLTTARIDVYDETKKKKYRKSIEVKVYKDVVPPAIGLTTLSTQSRNAPVIFNANVRDAESEIKQVVVFYYYTTSGLRHWSGRNIMTMTQARGASYQAMIRPFTFQRPTLIKYQILAQDKAGNWSLSPVSYLNVR